MRRNRRSESKVKMLFLCFVFVLASVRTAGEISHFERLCVREGPIDDTSFDFHVIEEHTYVRSVGSLASPRGGEKIHYAYTRAKLNADDVPTDCIIVAAPSLSGHATHTAQWLISLSASTGGCDIVVLEYRGFGLSKQRNAHKIGMKIASLAGDFDALVNHFAATHEHIYALGLSAGANVVWSWMQHYLTPHVAVKLRGILPLEGGLLAAPQLRAAAATFDIDSGAFSWSDMQTMTDRFLSADSNARCFEEMHAFFTQSGFFTTHLLADRYLRAMCDLDCVSFALLNKDSLLSDYTDAVLENTRGFRIPVFAFVAEGSIIPATTQEYIARNSPPRGSVRWSLPASKGGVHFALMPGELGHEKLVGAMSKFILELLRAGRSRSEL